MLKFAKKKKRKKSTKTKIKDRLDKKWSAKVREKGRCECCGKTGTLHAHHIFTRSKLSTRWDLDNGICLCPGCHTFSATLSAHKAPLEFHRWLESYKGKDFLDRLQEKSNSTKVFYEDDLLEIEKSL